MYIIMCVFTYTCVKNTTICQIVSLCNKQHYVIYNNYRFQPCKRAIIRLFVEPVSRLYNRSWRGWGGISSSIISTSRPNSYCIVYLLVPRTTWWWPTYKTETCSCIFRSVAYYIVILTNCCFLTACICEYTHNYIHCIIDLTQRGWHTLRRDIHISFSNTVKLTDKGLKRIMRWATLRVVSTDDRYGEGYFLRNQSKIPRVFF